MPNYFDNSPTAVEKSNQEFAGGAYFGKFAR